MAQKYKISLELRDKTRQNIRENNQHYIVCTARGLLNSNDYFISNEFPIKTTINGYFISIQRSKRQRRLSRSDKILERLLEEERRKG